jgi:hypothetical protein
MSFSWRLKLAAWSLQLEAQRLLLFREPGPAGLERELMQPWKLEVLRCKFFSDVNHGQVQLLMDGVRADGKPVGLVYYCELMFHISFHC